MFLNEILHSKNAGAGASLFRNKERGMSMQTLQCARHLQAAPIGRVPETVQYVSGNLAQVTENLESIANIAFNSSLGVQTHFIQAENIKGNLNAKEGVLQPAK